MMKRIKSLYYLNPQRVYSVLGFILCIGLLQLFSTCDVYAQKVTAPDDSASVQVRYPTSDHLRDLQTDHNYQYGNEAPPPENPLTRLIGWLFQKFAKFLTSDGYLNIWQYVILAAIAALVVYLLLKAEALSFLFPKAAQSHSLDYENLAENIHEINFETAIDEAINGRNFRLAVRLLYLQTLKRLNDGNLIDYKPDKTNRQYVYELTKSSVQADFEQLTRQFEFVWYGDFPVDDERFQKISQHFREFSRALSLSTSVND